MRMKTSDKRFAVLVSAIAMLFVALGSVGPLTAEEDPGLWYRHSVYPDAIVCKWQGCFMSGTCCNEPT